MNGQDLLKAMGEIREDYILEAEPVQEKRAGQPQEEESGQLKGSSQDEEKIIPWRKYVKPLGVLAAALVLVAGVGMYQNMQRSMLITEQSQTDTGNASEESEVQKYDAAEVTGEEAIASEYNSVSEEVPGEEVPELSTQEPDAEPELGKAAESTAFSADESREEESDQGAAFDLANAVESADNEEFAEEEDDLSLQNANMINPWITCSSLTEGEKIAGFTLKVPKAGRDYSEQEIYAVADTLIEVRYVDFDGEEGYRIRKGIGTESVDGDYNLYDTEYTVTIDEKEVTLKGNGSEVAVARWTENNYSYAITTENSKFSEKEITRLIREIQ